MNGRQARCSLFLATMIFGMYSVYLYMCGFHNLDLAQNLRYINENTHSNFVDKINGKEVTPEEMYLIGQQQQDLAFFVFAVSSFAAGAFFMCCMFVED